MEIRDTLCREISQLIIFRCKMLVILLKREAGLSPARSRHCNRELYRKCHCPMDGKTYKVLN